MPTSRILVLALTATIAAVTAGSAQTPNPVAPPSLPRAMKQYYRDHPQEFQDFLSRLADQRQRPVGAPYVAPAGGAWTALPSSGTSLNQPKLLTDGTVVFRVECSDGGWRKLTPDING